ncbi:hypothetical protein RSAG8_06149, partial [Rhizoctonia solani AG-8 WAC10335]
MTRSSWDESFWRCERRVGGAFLVNSSSYLAGAKSAATSASSFEIVQVEVMVAPGLAPHNDQLNCQPTCGVLSLGCSVRPKSQTLDLDSAS